MSCRLCLSYSPYSRNKFEEIRQCRYNPPTLKVGESDAYNAWPLVEADAWCGKFQLKEAK